MTSPEDSIFQDEEYAGHNYRVDLMKSLLVELFRPDADPKTGKVKPEDKQHAVLRNAVMGVLNVLAKYQDPDNDWDDDQDLAGIEKDMKRLVAYSAPIAGAGGRMKAHTTRFHAMGRKAGAEAILQEKARLRGKGEKFVVAAAEPLRDQAKGQFYIQEAKMLANAEALLQLASHADKLCNVLKKVHDRMLKEYAFSGGA